MSDMVTLNDLKGHSIVHQLTVDKILTDMMCRAVPLHVQSCLFTTVAGTNGGADTGHVQRAVVS